MGTLLDSQLVSQQEHVCHGQQRTRPVKALHAKRHLLPLETSVFHQKVVVDERVVFAANRLFVFGRRSRKTVHINLDFRKNRFGNSVKSSATLPSRKL